jgi:parallel beta-helix repeat protein
MKTRILFLFTLLCAAITSLQMVHAATITVTNTNDSGAGSLRQALAIANDDDTINFSVTTPATITLTSGQIEVYTSVAINGPGANLLAVNGNANGRVCVISSHNTPVTISGLTFTNGGGRDLVGGAGIWIDSHSKVTLINCTVSGNSTTGSGGGIYIADSELTLTNCVVSNNSAQSGGGISIGIRTRGRTTVTVNNSAISNNSTTSGGGGITNNGANGDPSSFAHLFVNNSTISGNSGPVGGGIFNTGVASRCSGCGATASVSNSTVSGNSASLDGGGGIYNNCGATYPGTTILIVKNSTISGNSGNLGGGIYNDGPLGMLTIGDTILRTGASGQNIYNTNSARVTSLGYNLSSDDGSGLLTGPGDQINTDPQISGLQNNGGPTLTHALLAFSPAIDHGNPGFTPPPGEDQRGCPFDRVFNNRIDVGSFESQPQPQSRPCSSPRPRPTPGPR